jgi:hypothetical protein
MCLITLVTFLQSAGLQSTLGGKSKRCLQILAYKLLITPQYGNTEIYSTMYREIVDRDTSLVCRELTEEQNTKWMTFDIALNMFAQCNKDIALNPVCSKATYNEIRRRLLRRFLSYVLILFAAHDHQMSINSHLVCK